MDRKEKIKYIINNLSLFDDSEIDDIYQTIIIKNSKDEENLKRHLLTKISHLIYEKNYNVGLDGNLSYRLNANEILISPSGVHKGFIKPSTFVIIDDSGNLLKGKKKPSSEYRLHTEIYKKRKDINAIIHAHSPYAIAASVIGINLMDLYITQPPIPTTEFALPSSEEGPEKIKKFINDFDCFILNRHGVVTYGKDVWDAFFKLERLEHTAKIIITSNTAKEIHPIDEYNKKRIIELYRGAKKI